MLIMRMYEYITTQCSKDKDSITWNYHNLDISTCIPV